MRCLVAFRAKGPDVCVTHIVAEDDDEVGNPRRSSVVVVLPTVAVAILWPRPVYYHVPATPQNLTDLAALAESHAEPELAVHFHVYREGKVLLEWHDAFGQPMLLDGGVSEKRVKAFADALGMTFELKAGAARRGGSGKGD